VNPRLRSAGERARAMKKKGLDVNDAVTAVRTAAPTAPTTASASEASTKKAPA